MPDFAALPTADIGGAADDATALYRHFDASGALLYVGISCNPFRRLNEHADRSNWSEKIAAVTLEWFASREEAEQAERGAIFAEKPKFNTMHSVSPRTNVRASASMVPAQCRAARALLDWPRETLAESSKVGLRTLIDFERGAREPREVTRDALRRALEAAGVTFIASDGEGPGVRFSKPPVAE
jgi:ribosome-binding protein aMBF1 (putative translation factor)